MSSTGDRRRNDRFLRLPVVRPFPAPALPRRHRPSLALGIALRPARLLLQRLLLRRSCASLPWAVSFPRGSPPWMHQVAGRTDLRSERLVAPGPSDPALLGDRWPGPARPALGLLSAPAPRRRGDGAADGDVSRHAVPDRVSPERRAGSSLGLTISQTISVFLLLAGPCYWAWLCGRCRRQSGNPRRSADVGIELAGEPADGGRRPALDSSRQGTGMWSRMPPDDVVGGEALGFGLGADDDPVAEDVACQALDVVRRHVVAAGEQGVAARGPHQSDRGARARPELEQGGQSRP